MSKRSNQEEVAVLYLLRALSEPERDQLEEQYFSADDEFEKVEIAEDDLVDRYVRGKLSAPDVERFEEVLANSPRLVERVKLARILTNQIDSRWHASIVTKESERPRWWNRWFGSSLRLTPAFRSAMVAAMALILLAGVALIGGWLNSRRSFQQLASEKAQIELQIRQLKEEIAQQRARTDQLDAELQARQNELNAREQQLEELRAHQLENSKQTGTASLATSIVLQPGAIRSSQSSKTDFVVKPNLSTVIFTLKVRTNDHDRYNVVVESPERGLVHKESRLLPRKDPTGTTIHFAVSAKRITPGDYTIRLEAASSNEPIDEYFFRITPR